MASRNSVACDPSSSVLIGAWPPRSHQHEAQKRIGRPGAGHKRARSSRQWSIDKDVRIDNWALKRFDHLNTKRSLTVCAQPCIEVWGW